MREPKGSGQPIGFKQKDIGRLIEFVSNPDYWEKLTEDARSEILEILKGVTGLAGSPIGSTVKSIDDDPAQAVKLPDRDVVTHQEDPN